MFSVRRDRHGDRCDLIDGVIGEGHLHPSVSRSALYCDQAFWGSLRIRTNIPTEWVQFHANGKRP